MKLGLGTAQFGMDYSLPNMRGTVPLPEIVEILDLAQTTGVEVIDTAFSYGTSEEVLGRYLPTAGSFCVVTKTSPAGGSGVSVSDVEHVVDNFQRSLTKLRVPRVYGLLAH